MHDSTFRNDPFCSLVIIDIFRLKLETVSFLLSSFLYLTPHQSLCTCKALPPSSLIQPLCPCRPWLASATHQDMSFAPTLRAWAPKKAPKAWIVINAVCCVWSLLLLLIIIFATDDSAGKRIAKAQYLVYDLATTVVWVAETGLTTVFEYNATSWQQWLEFILAIYFLGDSAVVVHKWKLRKEHTSEMGIAVFIGFGAYLYTTMSSMRDLRRRQEDYVELRDEEGFLPAEDPMNDIPNTEKIVV